MSTFWQRHKAKKARKFKRVRQPGLYKYFHPVAMTHVGIQNTYNNQKQSAQDYKKRGIQYGMQEAYFAQHEQERRDMLRRNSDYSNADIIRAILHKYNAFQLIVGILVIAVLIWLIYIGGKSDFIDFINKTSQLF